MNRKHATWLFGIAYCHDYDATGLKCLMFAFGRVSIDVTWR